MRKKKSWTGEASGRNSFSQVQRDDVRSPRCNLKKKFQITFSYPREGPKEKSLSGYVSARRKTTVIRCAFSDKNGGGSYGTDNNVLLQKSEVTTEAFGADGLLHQISAMVDKRLSVLKEDFLMAQTPSRPSPNRCKCHWKELGNRENV